MILLKRMVVKQSFFFGFSIRDNFYKIIKGRHVRYNKSNFYFIFITYLEYFLTRNIIAAKDKQLDLLRIIRKTGEKI
jgi:hypothetical protein